MPLGLTGYLNDQNKNISNKAHTSFLPMNAAFNLQS